jgi:hypothetical protein
MGFSPGSTIEKLMRESKTQRLYVMNGWEYKLKDNVIVRARG